MVALLESLACSAGGHITRMALTAVSIACLPWAAVMLGYLLLITYVPAISLWLPNLLYGT